MRWPRRKVRAPSLVWRIRLIIKTCENICHIGGYLNYNYTHVFKSIVRTVQLYVVRNMAFSNISFA